MLTAFATGEKYIIAALSDGLIKTLIKSGESMPNDESGMRRMVRVELFAYIYRLPVYIKQGMLMTTGAGGMLKPCSE